MPVSQALMEGTIVNYRMSRRNQNTKHIVISVSGYADKEKAKALVGKHVIWVTQTGKELKGKIAAPHGNKGAVRAIFETGVPGQAIGTKVKIS
jgi:large subunit ribosomal protein L35Ae